MGSTLDIARKEELRRGERRQGGRGPGTIRSGAEQMWNKKSGSREKRRPAGHRTTEKTERRGHLPPMGALRNTYNYILFLL